MANKGYMETLEDKLTLHIVSDDPILIKCLRADFKSDGVDFAPSPLSSLTEDGISNIPIGGNGRPMDIYVVDTLPLKRKDYQKLNEKIKYLKAIRPESKIMVLVANYKSLPPELLKDLVSKEAPECSLADIVDNKTKVKATPYLEDAAYNEISEYISKEWNASIFKNFEEDRKNLTVIKIGGSIFDLYSPEVLLNLLKAIVEAQESNDIAITIGGGPINAFAANYNKSFRLPEEAYRKYMVGYEKVSKDAIEWNAEKVRGLLEIINPGISAYISPEYLYSNLTNNAPIFDGKFFRRTIPIIPLLPEIKTEKFEIPKMPPYNSDVHSVYLANLLGACLGIPIKMIFAKNTDGIYLRDKNMPPDIAASLGLDPENNPFFPYITAAGILQGKIDRRGFEPKTGEVTDEHLIETGALKLFMQLRIYMPSRLSTAQSRKRLQRL